MWHEDVPARMNSRMSSHRDAEFTEYMSARMPSLRRLARLLCQDWSLADDLLQAAMTKAYVHWSKAAGADNTDAYVRAILVREFVQERRTGWAQRVTLASRPIETAVAPDDQDSALDLRAAVGALPPRQRAVLVLRYFCDLNVDTRPLMSSAARRARSRARQPGPWRRCAGRSAPAMTTLLPADRLGLPAAASHGRWQAMLEHALAELFEQQASENPPRTCASVAAATRQGRTRRRRRVAISVAAPVLAAAAVLAIAVTGVLAGPAPVPPAQQDGPGHALPARPAKILRVTGVPDWLPPGTTLRGVVADSDSSGIDAFGPAGSLLETTYRRHLCSLQESKLSCPGPGSVAFTLALTGPAPDIDGRPAYWGANTGEAFEYAPGSWAVSVGPTRADDTAVLRHLVFGRTVQPVRYLAQLTGSWPGLGILSVIASPVHGVLGASQWFIGGPRFHVAATATSMAGGAVEISVYKATPGFCAGVKPDATAVINGIRVALWNEEAGKLHGVPYPAGQTLCAAADGEDIQIDVTGTQPGVTSLFAHLKLLGPDPADWTTRPIG
jgi:DNA-directed RNA polymerase specialized sigma24 family protein